MNLKNWFVKEAVTAPSALTRREKAEAALREIYSRPEIAAARQESEDAYREEQLIEKRDSWNRFSPLVIGRTIVDIGTVYGEAKDAYSRTDEQLPTLYLKRPPTVYVSALKFKFDDGSELNMDTKEFTLAALAANEKTA